MMIEGTEVTRGHGSKTTGRRGGTEPAYWSRTRRLREGTVQRPPGDAEARRPSHFGRGHGGYERARFKRPPGDAEARSLLIGRGHGGYERARFKDHRETRRHGAYQLVEDTEVTRGHGSKDHRETRRHGAYHLVEGTEVARGHGSKDHRETRRHGGSRFWSRTRRLREGTVQKTTGRRGGTEPYHLVEDTEVTRGHGSKTTGRRGGTEPYRLVEGTEVQRGHGSKDQPGRRGGTEPYPIGRGHGGCERGTVQKTTRRRGGTEPYQLVEGTEVTRGHGSKDAAGRREARPGTVYRRQAVQPIRAIWGQIFARGGDCRRSAAGGRLRRTRQAHGQEPDFAGRGERVARRLRGKLVVCCGDGARDGLRQRPLHGHPCHRHDGKCRVLGDLRRHDTGNGQRHREGQRLHARMECAGSRRSGWHQLSVLVSERDGNAGSRRRYQGRLCRNRVRNPGQWQRDRQEAVRND